MNLYRLFYPTILLKALVMIGIILYAGIGLGPDEAQYWTWSRHLDIGYYSKPPGIAWQIFSSTSLLGSTELGVRFSAVVMGTLFAYAVFRLAKKSGCSLTASAIAGILAAFTPLGVFSTFLTITDGGLLLFWTLALTELMEETPSPIRFGLFVALGALFKWPIYLIWIIALAFPKMRTKNMIAGVLISLLGLLPTLIWNYEHDFATFRHVFTTVQGSNEGGQGNPLEFAVSQIALLSPLIFLVACLSVFRIKRSPVAILGWISIAILASYLGYSFFKKGQGNWCLFAYPSLFVFIADYLQERKGWFNWGIVTSVLLVACAFAIPTLQKSYSIPWKINPFRHNLGWERLGEALDHFDPKTEFLFADKYQMTSLLSFYNLKQTQSYFFNLLGIRKNQFSYWPGPEAGKDGIFVVVENEPKLDEKMENLKGFYPEKLAPYFKKIHEAERVSLFEVNGKSVKQALIFKCEHYLGKLPPDPEKY